MKLNERKIACILAALRLAQKNYESFKGMIHHSEIQPLTIEEMDKLCEEINFENFSQSDITEAYIQLWTAVENGEVNKKHSELMSTFHYLIQGPYPNYRTEGLSERDFKVLGDVLANDEDSSDEEFLDYLLSEGIPEKYSLQALKIRHHFFENVLVRLIYHRSTDELMAQAIKFLS